MSLETFLIWLVIGLIAGWLASAIVGGGYGIVGDIVIGIVGAVVVVAEAVSPSVVRIDVAGERPGAPRGSGSGIVFTADGYVLTNSHVVSAAKRITVTTRDGDKIPATLVGDDPDTDLGVVRVYGTNLVLVTFGD